MDRRNFLAAGLAAGAGISVGASGTSAQKKSNSAKFKLRYGPGFNTFRSHVGKDPIENIKFAADQGFTAMFDNRIDRKPVELQKKIVKEMAKRDMKLGPFVLYADFGKKSFVTQDKEVRKMLIERMKSGVEVARRVNTDKVLVVPGRFDEGLEWDYQTANVVENCKYCCEILEPAGISMVLEPLNAWKNHPGLFLTKMPQAFMICQAVGSPACQIVDDIYHQQITEGNIIPNIDKCWSRIGAFHIGDNPGRKEPGTGEINYKNVFGHIYKKGFKGVLCCEHGKSIGGKEGELAFIEAYRWADSFEA
ncbi:MAG: xylose isomerase [Planctomycetota bacterium]|nr:MAG: xylose isomerase [Planctomycetota bacterium]